MNAEDWTPFEAPMLAQMRSPWDEGAMVSKTSGLIHVTPVERRPLLPSELGARVRPTPHRAKDGQGAYQKERTRSILLQMRSQSSHATRSPSHPKPPRLRTETLFLTEPEDVTLQRYTPRHCALL